MPKREAFWDRRPGFCEEVYKHLEEAAQLFREVPINIERIRNLQDAAVGHHLVDRVYLCGQDDYQRAINDVIELAEEKGAPLPMKVVNGQIEYLSREEWLQKAYSANV